MKRKIEIEDTLGERCQGAIDEVKGLLLEYLKDNPDTDSLPCISNDLDYSGGVHEIVDGSVPIYTYEIDNTWYLHANRLEEAYENAGVGENPRENNGMSAIYFAIFEAVYEWYNDEADGVFEEWLESQAATGRSTPRTCHEVLPGETLPDYDKKATQ